MSDNDAHAAAETDFDDWLIGAFAETGPFTMLFVLVAIGETTVTLLRSAYLHVVGDETRWPDMLALFAGAKVDWSGAIFFRAGREGLVEDGEAKRRLAELTGRLNQDLSIIKEGDFFNAQGLRMKLEEAQPDEKLS